MKKIYFFILTIGISLAVVGCANVNADVFDSTAGTTPTTTLTSTTTTTTTTTTETITATDGDGNVYYYTDYQDLVNQIYQEIYDSMYDEIYASVSSIVTSDIYDEIYASVEQELNQTVDQATLDVYAQILQNKIYNVTNIVNNSVVGVSTYQDADGVALGTGVIYYHNTTTDTYYLITNNHVIEDGNNYRVVFADDSYITATLVGTDATIDIAILSFSGSSLSEELPVVTLGSSSTLEQGTMVIAAGNPQGYDFYGSMTIGVVSGLDRDVDGDGVVLYIQHDASINAGNSGGPLFNLAGEVIGINVAKFASTEIEGMGFAIPIDTVISVIQQYAPSTLN